MYFALYASLLAIKANKSPFIEKTVKRVFVGAKKCYYFMIIFRVSQLLFKTVFALLYVVNIEFKRMEIVQEKSNYYLHYH